VEAVFRPETFRIFSYAFRSIPAGKHRKWAGIHQKNPKHFRSEYYFHVPAICGAFPHLFCKILRDPVAGIIDLGSRGPLPKNFNF
jgi:hypothetical protein